MRRISTQILLPLLVVGAQLYAQDITGSITGRRTRRLFESISSLEPRIMGLPASMCATTSP